MAQHVYSSSKENLHAKEQPCLTQTTHYSVVISRELCSKSLKAGLQTALGTQRLSLLLSHLPQL